MSARLDGEFIGSIDESLPEISTLVAELLNAKSCKILLLSEKRVTQIGLCLGGAEFGDLPNFECEKAHGSRHARSEISGAPIQNAQRYSESGAAVQDRMFAAIVAHGKTIGAVCVREPQQKQCFSTADLSMLRTLTVLVSKTVQANRLQQILDSPFAQMSLSTSSKKRFMKLFRAARRTPISLPAFLQGHFIEK
jgi:GAF domain-containing protein